MSYWQLGQKDEARKWYDQAVTWMKDNKPDEDLLRVRPEADKLLGNVTENRVERQPASSAKESPAAGAAQEGTPLDRQ